MKRLTGRAPDGTAYLYNMGGTNTTIDRLAAYEDTGLEPEEISTRRWIPVTERVPEVDQPVMICAFGKSVGEGVYRGHDGFHHVWKMYTSSGTYWDDEVTHWMPLPEPPEEVAQNA